MPDADADMTAILASNAKPLTSLLDDSRTAAALLVLHLLIWTALPLLVSRNLPLDVVEALAWGREWQWGYYKHPPLSGWLAEMARLGPSNWSLFLLAQLMVTGGMAASWALGRELLGTRLATLGLMATEGIHYFNMSSTEFNANVVLFPLWAGASLCGWRALRSGKLGWWMALGLCCGLGTLGKYVFLLLPACLVLYTWINPVARQAWRTAGPWAAAAVFLLVIAPHLKWAIDHDWATLHYALGRGHSDELAQQGSWRQEFIHFVLAQALTLLPAWGLLRTLGASRPTQRPAHERGLLFTLALAPLLLIMLAATLAQAQMLHMWASPFFLCAVPLWLAWRQPAALNTSRFTWAWSTWMLITVVIFASTALLGPQKKHKLDRTSYPGQEIAAILTAKWHTQTGRPLSIVAGEEFVAGTVAHYSADRPSVFYDADFSESLWLRPEQVTQQGAVFVWPLSRGEVDVTTLPMDSREQVAPLLARYPRLQIQPTLLVNTHWMGKPYTVAVAWAILPPSPPAQNFSAR
ncbi:MAG: glycosyltransferase family 39 protein [Aquabacterium sp.]|uniref:glycosyltransferase family 39 protein n=1 Tax=Aquabacterium sp. TaxID=1872578 RepID=UPI0025BAAA94|nr:glycosyltransferase family 39 protein [Aquabacterium sp.]MBI3382495.1 glycosyltransferase family 39 protein [Aquabacterium sp.]